MRRPDVSHGSTESMPRRGGASWRRLLRAALIAAAVVLAAWSVWIVLPLLTARTIRIVTPGQVTITLPAPGSYIVLWQRDAYPTLSASPDPPDLTLTATASDQPVALHRPYPGFEVTLQDTTRQAVAEFSVDRAGTYVLSAPHLYDQVAPEIVLVVVPGTIAGYWPRSVLPLVGAMATFFATFFVPASERGTEPTRPAPSGDGTPGAPSGGGDAPAPQGPPSAERPPRQYPSPPS